MNRFSVNHNYVTNGSMTKAGNVRRMCNIFLLFKMTVCRQSSSQNYTKKGKNITLYVKDLILFLKALFFKKSSMGDFKPSTWRDAVGIWVVYASPQLSLLRRQRAYFAFQRKLKLHIFISLDKHIELRDHQAIQLPLQPVIQRSTKNESWYKFGVY